MKPILSCSILLFALLLTACGPITAAAPTLAPLNTPTAPPLGNSILVWQRSGGIAGFCDKVVVGPAFDATIYNCKGEVKVSFKLTETQIMQLKDWLSTYQPIEYIHSDPPMAADGMYISLQLAGRGDHKADDDAIQTIMRFASDLAAQAQINLNPPPEKMEAEKALREFFIALNTGDYILGAKLYGGDTELLQTWNSDIKDNLPKWLELACTQNGLVCMTPRTITYRGVDADGNQQFGVEFNNPDGTLFVQGPCCGETEGPTFSSFPFRVKKIESGYVVLDLPPYVP